MIRIRERTYYPRMYETVCPFCCTDIEFLQISPVYCSECQEELPNFAGVIKDVEDRVDYFKDGLQYHYKTGK